MRDIKMDDIERLKEIIERSERIVFFGGAGVSTESGIPDFRSKDGLYNQHDIRFERYTPEYLLSHECLVDEPEVFFEFYRQKMDTEKIMPNPAHMTLAEWEEKGILSAVVTQNIDGLHQKAGSRKVFELHGSTQRNYCMKCGKAVDPGFIFHSEGVPVCPDCGGMIRPDVVLYGEGLDDTVVRGAIKAISEADTIIVSGTSLTVYPAAGFVGYFGGDHFVIINRDPIPYEDKADLVIHGSVGKVLSAVSSGK